jgi:hypothetical protein
MSIFTMAFTGTMPVGNLIVGSAAARFGGAATLLASGLFCAIVVALFFQQLPRLTAAAAPLLAKLEAEGGTLASPARANPGPEGS